MDIPFQSVVPPAHSAHGRSQSKPRTNKISQKLSTLRGIIRIPTRRSSTRDDITVTSLSSLTRNPAAHQQQLQSQHQHQHQHQRSRSTATDDDFGMPVVGIGDNVVNTQTHRRWAKSKNNPYGSYSSSSNGDKDLGLKPYMSQPMLGTELLRDIRGEEEEGRGRRSRGSMDDEDEEGDMDTYLNHDRHLHNHTFGYEYEDGQSQSGLGSASGSGEGSGSGYGALEVEPASGDVVPRGERVPSSTSTPPPPPPSASSKPTLSQRPPSHPPPPPPASAATMHDDESPPITEPLHNPDTRTRTSVNADSKPTTPGRPFSPSASATPSSMVSVVLSGSKSDSRSNPTQVQPPQAQQQQQQQQQHGKKFSISNALFGSGGAHAGLSGAVAVRKNEFSAVDGSGPSIMALNNSNHHQEKNTNTKTGTIQTRSHTRAPSRDLPPLPPLSPLEDSAPIGLIFNSGGDGGGGDDDEREIITTIIVDSRLDSNSNLSDTATITNTTVPISMAASPPLPPPPPPKLRLSVSADPSFHSQHVDPQGHQPTTSTSSYMHLNSNSNSNSNPSPNFNPSLQTPIVTLTTSASDGPKVLSSSSPASSSLAANTDNSKLAVVGDNIISSEADIAFATSRSRAAAGATGAASPTTTTTRTLSTSGSPKLKRPPPNHRFSLTFSSSTSSMPGGVPILPLPAVPIYGVGQQQQGGVGAGEKPNGNGNSRAKRLSGMPALHLQGTGRGTRAHEEVDEEEYDEEEEAEEEDEEDEDMEMGGEMSRSSMSSEVSVGSSEGYSNSSVSSSSEAMATLGSRTTIASSSSRYHGAGGYDNTGVDEDVDDEDDDGRSIASRTSSYKTAPMDQPSAPASTSHSPMPSPVAGPSSLEPHSYFGDTTRPPDKRFSRAPLLPPVETGKLELDFSFLDKPPPSDVLGFKAGGISKKGKGRAGNRHTVDVDRDRRLEDAGKTPIARRGSTPWGSSASRNAAPAPANTQVDYFAPNYPPRPSQEFRDARSFSERTIQGVQQGNSSPTRTPRAEDYFQSLNVMTPTIGSCAVDTGLPANTMPPMPQRSSEARLSSRLSITQHPAIYKHASRSLIDVHAAEKKEKVEQMVREEEEAEEENRKRRVKALRMSMKAAVRGSPFEETSEYLGAPGSSYGVVPSEAGGTDGRSLVKNSDNVRDPRRTSTTTAKSGGVEVFSSAGSCSASGVIGFGEGKDGSAGGAGAGLNKRISMAPPYEALSHPLRKRRSMPTFTATTAPPPYPDFAPHPAFGLKNIQIMPREDEGKEKLPPYTNDIKLMAIMPRKLEFSRPGFQAKDRKWRRVLVVLEGTMLKIYKAPSGASGVSAIGEWWESKVGVGDVAQQAPLTTSSFQTSSVTANGPSRRLSGTNPGDFIRGSGEEGVRAAIAAVEQAEREEEERRERDLVRARKNGEFDVAIQSPVPDSPDVESPVQVQTTPALQVQVQGQNHFHPEHMSHESHFGSGGLIPATRSALNLAVQLLKPGGSSRHGRSNSDVCPSPTRPRSPRSSLNIPRSGRTTPTSSLRSRSPTPSPSLINHSRPSTPATSISMSSTSQTQLNSQTGFRVGAGSMGNSNSRTNNNKRPGQPRVNVGLTPREKEKAKEKVIAPQESDLIRVYTMQNAESGLGSDYLKRKHVIRVRLEGEQFLLQAKDVDSVIAWIEGLQSATNIALDLDERPMPRGPIFPRRRRRRRVQPPSINTNTANIAPANPSPTGQTPVTASHLAAPLTRSARRM